MDFSLLVWPAVIAAAIVLFFTPLIIAAIRHAEPIGMVVLLTVLTLAGGVFWFGALYAAFALPRNKPARRRRPLQPYQASPTGRDWEHY